MDAANYSAIEELRDGRKVEIRALRPGDRTGLLAAIGRAGKQSIFQRFFAFKRGFTEKEITPTQPNAREDDPIGKGVTVHEFVAGVDSRVGRRHPLSSHLVLRFEHLAPTHPPNTGGLN